MNFLGRIDKTPDGTSVHTVVSLDATNQPASCNGAAPHRQSSDLSRSRVIAPVSVYFPTRRNANFCAY